MTALHVVVRPRPESAPSSALASLHGVLDVVVEGVNITARIGEGQALDFLMDLAFATLTAVCSPRRRATVPLHSGNEAWEVGLECDGDELLLSVFCPGPVPSVATHARRVPLQAFRAALLQALTQAVDHDPGLPSPVRLGLKTASEALHGLDLPKPGVRIERREVRVEHKVGSLHLSATVPLRVAPPHGPTSDLERADLLSLLAEGELCFAVGKSVRYAGPSQVFLDVERLLGLADCAVESWRSARPTFRRVQLGCGRFGMRRGPGEAPIELTVVSGNKPGVQPRTHRIECDKFAALAFGFADKLAEAITECDPEQRRNLRLCNLRNLSAQLREQLQFGSDDESVANPRPDNYRRFVPKLRRAVGIWETGPKMRFMPRWVASVPQIDLRATFLCGDQLMVGGAQETACLRRSTGEMVWKRSTRPAACVVTPAGLVRIEPDGQLRCHRLDDGEVRFTLAVTPRSAGGVAGSVISGPGMPMLLALVEGQRHVTGIDLVSGAVRWRHTTKRSANYRLRRAGRLLLVSGGDPLLVALDAVSGEVVWSLRTRLPLTGDVSVDHDSAFTLSGSAGGRTRVHRINPWSGASEWEVELDERPAAGRAPLLTPRAVIVPTVEQEGCGAVAYDRASGKKLWEHAPGLVGHTAAWLAVDDCLVVNGSSGVLLGLDAADGRMRFQHVFSSSTDAEQPRRLEPVLRSGALFVPQQQVHVVRPRDGELLGTLPSDLIPDLIRVDERCDVYVAEESGHLAAFGAAPRLAVVR